MLLLLLPGCYLPTAYGLRDDGLLPATRSTELTAQVSQFGLYAESAPAPMTGLQGRWRLGERVGLRANLSALVGLGEEPGIVTSGAEADLLVGVLQEPEAPLTLTLSGGGSVLGLPWLSYGGESLSLASVQTGATVSRTVANTLHPYVGVRVNPILGANEPTVWLHTGAGLGWRPPLGDRVTGSFGVEGGWDHGAGLCLSQGDDGTCDTWSVGLYGGVTIAGPKARRVAERGPVEALPVGF